MYMNCAGHTLQTSPAVILHACNTADFDLWWHLHSAYVDSSSVMASSITARLGTVSHDTAVPVAELWLPAQVRDQQPLMAHSGVLRWWRSHVSVATRHAATRELYT